MSRDYREGDTSMVLRTTGSVLVVFLWSLTGVAVVLGQSVKYTSQKICALKGSTVDLSCYYTNPWGYTVTATEWYYRKHGIWTKIPDNSAGRVSYRGNMDNDCTLRITDLREEDSGSYYFRFTTGYSWISGSQIVLSVTDLQVNVGWYNERTLTCSSSCSLPYQTTYIWYKNGQRVSGDSSSLYVHDFSNGDSYSCGVKGHENLLAPAVCKDSYCVKYTSQRICVLKGSTVDLSCSYTYPRYQDVKTTEWYYQKNGNWKAIVDNSTGRVLYLGNKDKDCTLRITDLRETDSASYFFSFKTGFHWTTGSHITMSVTDLQVEVTGEDIKTLTCRTTCSLTGNPTYIWYKNGQPVVEGNSSFYVHKFSDEDRYSCAVKGHDSLLSPAVCNNDNCVTYSSQRICALKGSTVDLSCSFTYPRGYTVTATEWYYWKNHDWKKISDDNAGRVSYCGNKVNNCTLRITDLREEDSTSYIFSFATWDYRKDGSSISLTVIDVVLEMEPTSVSEGNRVTLTCTTKCSLDPNPEYSWYKNGQPIENTNTNSTVHILSVSSEDAGRYSCGVKGHETLLSPEKTLNVTYPPKNPSVSISPSGEIVEGSSVTLTCSSDANPPVDKYTWYKKNVTSPKESGQSYSITNITSEDSGEYYCEVRNGRGSMYSSALMVTFAGKQTSVLTASVGITVVVLVLILCLSGYICFRRGDIYVFETKFHIYTQM